MLAFEICSAPEAVAVQLNIEPGTSVLHIKRLRLVDERPVALHDAYLTRLDVERAELNRIGSLYQLLEQRGVRLTEAEENLDAIVAGGELVGLLKVPKGAPLLQVTRITFNQHHTPIEIVQAIYRANFYRYTIRLYR